MQFGLMMRAQFPRGDDMQARVRELVEQARLANRLGYASITKGMHYSAAPWRDLQQFPFLCRIMAEAPSLRLNFGLVLLSLRSGPLSLYSEETRTREGLPTPTFVQRAVGSLAKDDIVEKTPGGQYRLAEPFLRVRMHLADDVVLG